MTGVLSWIDIVLGTLVGVPSLIKLTAGRGKPEMTKPGARGNAWSYLRTSLLVIIIGIIPVGEGAKDDAVKWIARLAIFVILCFTVTSWLRPRLRGKRTGRSTEAASNPGAEQPPSSDGT